MTKVLLTLILLIGSSPVLADTSKENLKDIAIKEISKKIAVLRSASMVELKKDIENNFDFVTLISKTETKIHSKKLWFSAD